MHSYFSSPWVVQTPCSGENRSPAEGDAAVEG